MLGVGIGGGFHFGGGGNGDVKGVVGSGEEEPVVVVVEDVVEGHEFRHASWYQTGARVQ